MFSFRYAPDFPGYFEVLYHPKTVENFVELVVFWEMFVDEL